ncbi:MAG: RNA pyrophosphohydrolase [Rhodobacteraceae bacterium]|nr:RNA pyrophosphohydrolase [Paracoccaceae bacterium]
MVLNDKGQVWIGQRDDGAGKSDYQYSWQMPQGGIDPDEDPRLAALRELYEETSIKSVSVIGEIEDWLSYDYPEEVRKNSSRGKKHRGQAQKWYALRFEGDESEINVVSPPDGHSAEFVTWKWEDASKLPDLIVPFKRRVYEQVIEGFKDLLGKAA